jgi:transcription elongation factor GreA-like protein
LEIAYCTAPEREFAAAMRENPANIALSPGDFVRHPDRPEWGLGQIQSIVGPRITVNFENTGKLLIDGRFVELEPAELPRA